MPVRAFDRETAVCVALHINTVYKELEGFSGVSEVFDREIAVAVALHIKSAS